MLDDFRNKAVLITGSSQGIGAAAALGFAELGADVAVHYNTSREQALELVERIRKLGRNAVALGGDLGQPGTARQLVEEAAAALARLDVLVNNAGAMIRRAPFLDLDSGLYEAALNLNVKSVIDASQAAVPHMEKQGGGAIINVGSIAGSDGGGPGSGHYACAKAYVHNLTRHMARDLASRHIRVNCLSPGVIETAFHAATPAERMAAMKKAVPMGRAGTPEDCVGPILFLASNQMAGYVTGQILHVNGGQHMG